MSHSPRYQRMQIERHILAERRRRLIQGRPTSRDAPERDRDA